jgi:hypothetical protein
LGFKGQYDGIFLFSGKKVRNLGFLVQKLFSAIKDSFGG